MKRPTLEQLTDAMLTAADAWSNRIIQGDDEERSDLSLALLDAINLRKIRIAEKEARHGN